MNFEQRLATASKLERLGKLSIGNGKGKPKDTIIVRNGLVYVNEEPMTWDTFTHIYLFNKEQ